MSYTRLELFNAWQQTSARSLAEKTKELRETIISSFDDDILAAHSHDIILNLNRCISKILKKWRDCNRTRERFLKINKAWLNNTVILLNPHREGLEQPSTSHTAAGHPFQFQDSSERSKRRKTEQSIESSSPGQPSYAFQTHSQEAALEMSLDSQKKPMKISPDEALLLIVETHLTKQQYTAIRVLNKHKCADIYPTYNKVRKAKELCYPARESIIISALEGEVKLQALLDHTLQRIILAQNDIFTPAYTEDVSSKLTLISKWGCDGSTGCSEYKQSLPDEGTDADMYVTSFVPLQLYAEKSDCSRLILWQNPRPASIRYCRPIKFQFRKETTELTQQEIDNVERQISKLVPFKLNVGQKEFSINHNLLLTMVDGQICNAAISTSSAQVCYVCGATPKEMNSIDAALAKNVDPSTFRFGLSTLHVWIRFFECFLHIAYRLDFKKWQTSEENTALLNARKATIQQRFHTEMGLFVDKVKVGNSGTSNDEHNARKFFKFAEKSAEITGLNLELLKRARTILLAMSSGYRINKEKFKLFSIETARVFVKEYEWYFMPASVHKILIHGADIIGEAVLPIGQLSEEAQQSRNKILKMYWRGHSRKFSRSVANEDLLHRLLVSSDPYISSLQELRKRRKESLNAEMLDLLIEPEVIIDAAKQHFVGESSFVASSGTETSDDDGDDSDF